MKKASRKWSENQSSYRREDVNIGPCQRPVQYHDSNVFSTAGTQKKGGGRNELPKQINCKIIITNPQSTTNIHRRNFTHINHFKIIFMSPRSIAGVPFESVGRFLATLPLRTTCMRSCCTWSVSDMSAQQTENQKREGQAARL